jgi:hypothetical protein
MLSTTVILYSVNNLWITQLLYAAQVFQVAAVAAAVHGARSRNRTGTLVKARDFKSLVSTYFTIRARVTLLTAAVSLVAASLFSHAAVNVGQSYWIRTSDLQLRRLLLYPTELRTAAVLGGPPVSRTRHQRIMSPLL